MRLRSIIRTFLYCSFALLAAGAIGFTGWLAVLPLRPYLALFSPTLSAISGAGATLLQMWVMAKIDLDDENTPRWYGLIIVFLIGSLSNFVGSIGGWRPYDHNANYVICGMIAGFVLASIVILFKNKNGSSTIPSNPSGVTLNSLKKADSPKRNRLFDLDKKKNPSSPRLRKSLLNIRVYQK